MKYHNEVFNIKITPGEAGTYKLAVSIKSKYRRLLKIAKKTKSWKSQARIVKRIFKAIEDQRWIAEKLVKEGDPCQKSS
ncbi:hypothetical protein KCG48_10550 [Proteiniclasticum sp. BAD-10]|uniref:Uncharacterized protein n=1 Tax=Proteiniclasticum sediminis TaxID=2804028 RepID=A0A941CQC0_9CLOT|nr:hypothetical protein [Proteiniclasticum sediminis]MBR0576772.1 hypothetical protein [Proteiniclasticum sediminis]